MFLDKIENRRNKKWLDIEKMQQSGLPLVMYGAGINATLCWQLLKKHSIRVDAVCVTEKKYVGQMQYFEGMPVITLKEVAEKFAKFNCLIGFADIPDAKKNLAAYTGVTDSFVIDNPDIVEEIEYSYVSENIELFENTYYLLSDEKSKTAFIDFLNARIGGEPNFENVTEPQYFCDIMPLTNDEVLIDCGAYDGDTIFIFLKETAGRYKSIYAFEPDSNNYQKLKQNIDERNIKNVRLFQKGVWDKKDVLNFSSPVSTASYISQHGDFKIEVDSIDNVVAADKATIIKMDIEGAELMALKGATGVITRERPKLAICVYHKADDLITIPSFMTGLLKGYNFYLRRHSPFSLETVFYAIPDNASRAS